MYVDFSAVRVVYEFAGVMWCGWCSRESPTPGLVFSGAHGDSRNARTTKNISAEHQGSARICLCLDVRCYGGFLIAKVIFAAVADSTIHNAPCRMAGAVHSVDFMLLSF
jgi:hypothetical protein